MTVARASKDKTRYHRQVRSGFAPFILAVVGVVAGVTRWVMQGSGNVYTALDKRFYVEDPDLGWRAVETRTVWLGLEVLAVAVAITVGLAIGGWWISRRERKRAQRASFLRAVAWIAALAPGAVAVAAFASGSGPANARDTLPVAIQPTKGTGITGSIDAPRGLYQVVPHAGTTITAQITAGGEAFDARFVQGISGSWQGDPRDFTVPMTAQVSVPTASVDTGVGSRSNSARDGYLKAGTYPTITFTLDRLVTASSEGPDRVAFTARGTLGFVGGTHAVDVTGAIRKPDLQALTRLGLAGDVLLVQAQFAVVIAQTALASDAGDFDRDTIPIQVSLVLRRTGEP